jgi:hypothetical protein
MKKLLVINYFVMILMILSFLISCSVLNEPPTVEITGWCTENIDKSFWTKWGYSPEATAYFNIWVEASDPNGIDDIEWVQVQDPEYTTWVLKDSSTGVDLYNKEGGFFGGMIRCNSIRYPHAVCLGQYKVLVLDSFGNEAKDTIYFSQPGSTLGTGFIFSEDYTGVAAIEMLNRAIITNVTKEPNDITIEFEVDDTRVYNGLVILYNDSAEFIASSDYFKNTINSGTGIYTDGTTNILQIQSSEFELGSYTWDDVKGFHIVLTDGAQYSPEEEIWDHSSISIYIQI